MPFRFQEFAEHCTGTDCEHQAHRACPRCRAPLCDAHACEPHGCCQGCATEMYFAVSRAGQRHILSGGAITFSSVIGLYALYALPAVPPVAFGVMMSGIMAGIVAILWGGSISPRLADRSQRKLLKHPALLASEAGGPRTGQVAGAITGSLARW